jgi:hypothetical protein
MLLAVCPHVARAQGFTGETGVRWVSLSSAEPNSISGVVVDGPTGAAIEGATVFLPLTDIGTVSDVDGRFRIVNVGSIGPLQLVIQRIGYAQMSETVYVEADEGIVAYVGLSKATFRDCEFVCSGGDSCPARVLVAVHDLATGGVPSGEVTLTVRAQGLTATRTGRDDAGRQSSIALSAGRELGVEGPFEVDVSSPLYESWRASNVWLYQRGCFGPTSDVLHVWLLPRN